MSRDNPFGMHKQAAWKLKAADRRLPAWVRVAFLAYGHHRANGHAVFGMGELAQLLGSTEQPLDASNLRRAIRAAVDAGWLAKDSRSRCLIVPAHDVSGGLGKPDEPCPIHGRKRSNKAARTPSKEGQPVTPIRSQRGSPSDPPEGQPVTLSQRSDLGKRGAPSMTLLPTPATAPSTRVTVADDAAALRSAPVALEPPAIGAERRETGHKVVTDWDVDAPPEESKFWMLRMGPSAARSRDTR